MSTGRMSPRPDMNLLVVLYALLSERSVTRAAQSLGLSQPAVSASLARLRIHFDDEILTRVGNTYRLTPLAIRLIDQTSSALEATRSVFSTAALFDPATSTREFSLYGSDYAFAIVGSRVSLAVRESAPQVRFRFALHNPAIVEDPMNTLRNVDGMLLPRGFASDLPSMDLYEDDWLAVIWSGNDTVGDALTLEDLHRLPWVFTYKTRSAFTAASRQLETIGIEPRVDVVVEGFLALPYFIVGTDRIGIVQKRLADRMLAAGDLRVLPLPFDALRLSGALWWHPMHNDDPGHQWMRQQFRRHGRSVDGE